MVIHLQLLVQFLIFVAKKLKTKNNKVEMSQHYDLNPTCNILLMRFK